MSPSTKTQTAFRIEPEVLDGLREIRERDGVPVSEQVRRALAMWLDANAGKRKTDRKRAGTRKRP